MFRRLVYGLLLGLALGVIVAGVVVFILSRTQAKPTANPGDPTLPYTVAITVREDLLTAQINHPPPPKADEPPLPKQSVRNAKIRLRQDGTLELQGETTLAGITVPVQIVALPRIKNGKVEVAVSQSHIGALGLPTAVTSEVEAVVNRRLAQLIEQRGLEAVALIPADGQLTIRFK